MKKKIKPNFSLINVVGLAILILLSTTSEIRAQGQGNGGIPEVLKQLESVSAQLNQIENRIALLEDELVPCTPERYRAGLCGAGETPFDLAITLCASAGGEAKIEGKFAFESKTSVQGGAGWKEVLDVDATVEAGMPGVIFPFGVPLVLPSELAVGGGGNAGLGIDGCIEVGKIQIGLFVPRERILTMLDKIDQSQSELATLLVDTFDSPATALDISSLVGAIKAARSFSARDFESNDPFDVFSDSDFTVLRESLPLGGRLQRLMDNPGLMIPDIDPFNLRVCERLQNSPTISAKVANICDFLQNDLPEFAVVADAFELIGQMNGNILDFPDTIEYIVSDLLPDLPTPLPPLPSGSPFCQRFPRLCPFQ